MLPIDSQADAICGIIQIMAKKKVRELANGSQAVGLTAHQAREAIIAFEILEEFRTSTGKQVSLSAAIYEWVEVYKKLGEQTVREAVDGFIKTVATVERKDLAQAVNDFLTAAAVRAKANEGQRAQLPCLSCGNRQCDFLRELPGLSVASAVEKVITEVRVGRIEWRSVAIYSPGSDHWPHW